MNTTISNSRIPERPSKAEGNFYNPLCKKIGPGMNERIQKLRKLSFETEPSLSIERALIQTRFYKKGFWKIFNSCHARIEFS